MPEDKAAIYQTCLQAGEFQLLLESAGGEEYYVLPFSPKPDKY